MDPKSPIQTIARTSPVTFARLKKAHIQTWLDLLKVYPNRYRDYRTYYSGGFHEVGSLITAKGTITAVKIHLTKNGKSILSVTLKISDTHSIDAVWFNQPFLKSLLHVGMAMQASGSCAFFNKAISLEVEEYEILKSAGDPIHTGRLVPSHPQIAGISARTLREKIWYVARTVDFSGFPDLLNETLRTQYDLMAYSDAIKEIHFPATPESAAHARRTLAFYELFEKLLQSALVRMEWQKSTPSLPIALTPSQKEEVTSLIASLPFKLTHGQQAAIDEIIDNLRRPYPMNRFLQGDVGSGKTIVAAVAAYATALCGYSTLCMAPTEILAKQHYETLSSILAPRAIAVELVTSEHHHKKSDVPETHPRVVVGTQALLFKESTTQSAPIGLIVIDEQHRFGVKQRAALKLKGKNPHLLTMTATPIPRTISLVMYNELEVSLLDEMPLGRKPIKTYIVPPQKRTDAYAWIKKAILAEGTQAYIVCPLIETSLAETLKTVKTATLEYERLSKEVFPELHVGLLHGKCKPNEKQAIMEDFYANKINILVSTSVVEVGVDVPNASIMLIEGAERFGLAQLHQLRGRVGRGTAQSHCLLFTSDEDKTASSRLQFFAKNTNGMQLSEFDLKIRGPGELYGANQHGYGDLKLADLTNFSHVARVSQAVTEYLRSQKHGSSSPIDLKTQAVQISRD